MTDDEREAQGWREAALYAEDAESQDDFMTGWRTADRLRRTVEPQGEPSDAQVDRALEEYARVSGGRVYENAMRSALRAAGECDKTENT